MATRTWIGTDSGNEGDWDTAANWSGAAVPVDGDDVYFENSSQGVTEGFDQADIALASLNIGQSFTGAIGDADDYLDIGAAAVRIGYWDGPGNRPNGSGRIKLNLDDDDNTAATVIIEDTGTPTDADLPSVQLLLIGASTVEIRKGSAGVACAPGETSVLTSAHVGYTTNISGDADLLIGAGCTITTITKTGGDLILKCAVTTLTNDDGDLMTTGSGAITTVNVNGGTAVLNAIGTIAALNVQDSGIADFTKSAQARTVTTPKVDPSGTIKYDPNVVTMTNKIQPIAASGAVAVSVAEA